MKRLTEKDIKHEKGNYWVADLGDSYTVFKIGITCSESDSSYSRDSDGLSIAIARCNYLTGIERFKMKTKFIIQDWASNTLQYNGKFNRGCYGQDIGVPKKFKSFEDGWDWIYSNIKDEDCYQDLFVEELTNENT